MTRHRTTQPSMARPGRFRPVLLLVILAPALLLSWVGLEVWFAYSIKPEVQENYAGQLRALAESWQDTTGTNGWDALTEAARLHNEHVEQYEDAQTEARWRSGYEEYDTIVDPAGAREFLPIINESLSDEQVERLFGIMRGWAIETISMHDELGITATLDRFMSSSHTLVPIPDSSVEHNLDFFVGLSQFRELVFSLRAKAHLAREAGEWDLYSSSLERMLSIGRAVSYQPSIISRTYAAALSAHAMQAVIHDLNRGELPDDAILRLREAFDRVPPMNPIERVIDAERYLTKDFHQRFFGRGGRLIETRYAELAPMEGENHWISNVRGLWQPRWPHRERQIDEQYDEMLRILSLPFAERERQRPENRSKGFIARLTDPDDDDGPLPMFDPSLSFEERFLSTEPAFGIADSNISYRSLDDGLAQLLALEAFRIEHARYPEALDELVPDFLAALPPDFCTPDLRPWVYRRFDAPDESGRPYILYSVGFDAEDNAGSVPPVDLSRAMSRKHPGTDYVISHPPLPEAPED